MISKGTKLEIGAKFTVRRIDAGKVVIRLINSEGVLKLLRFIFFNFLAVKSCSKYVSRNGLSLCD